MTEIVSKFKSLGTFVSFGSLLSGLRRIGHHRFRRGGSLVPHTNVELSSASGLPRRNRPHHFPIMSDTLRKLRHLLLPGNIPVAPYLNLNI